MNLTVTVSRTLLGLPDLDLNNPAGGLVVVNLGPGRREINLNEVTSPVSDGAVVVGGRAEMQTAFMTVRAYASSEAAVLTLLDTVAEAMNQRQFLLTVTMEPSSGVAIAANTRTEVWSCYASDHSIGASGRWEADKLSGGWQDISFEIPRLPDALNYG